MSKFPSLEEIDHDLAEETQNGVDDTQGDFLSREKALLGDDAEAFGQPANGDAEVAGFEASFPALDTQPSESTLGPSGLVAEPVAPYLPGQPQDDNVTSQVKKLSLEESDKVREWKAKSDLEIEERDKLHETIREETREKAKKDIDDFYETYNGKKEQAIAETREAENKFIEERDADVGVGSTWERIVKLIDTSDNATKTKNSDKSRFKELLLSLKADSNAPGAAGY